ncbi:hypothetical protein CLOSTMETH_03566 [[Clostridium] methylpentosum DSM 5476]|uniref:Uncharacterized protein n=1 Tax=[Clostridium] methylpentosum DSM 5476 TaxID=537013 RepID=C0EI71_9FIRM|nr:hypothetical protein CLOSTMETH_03566 [[Clostridium] methylpentosum DSM 5476]
MTENFIPKETMKRGGIFAEIFWARGTSPCPKCRYAQPGQTLQNVKSGPANNRFFFRLT